MATGKKRYVISIPVATFWKLLVPSLIGAAIAGVLFVDIVVMPGVVGINREMKMVPSVVGLTLDDGREKLFASGLLTEVQSRDYDNSAPDGTIISQNPRQGEKVKKGRRILVSVSRGKEMTTIPSLRDLTERQARIALKKNGITVGAVKKIYSTEVPLDIVINAFPESGTTISRHMSVDLIISKGVRPTSAEMPNIVGESLNEAKKIIEESGLTVGRITYTNDASLLPGTVVSQSVSPGENVSLSTPVDMTVSVIQ